MPKELTHLIIAEACRKNLNKLSPHSLLSQCLDRHVDFFRFGSLMHDIAFCASSSNLGLRLKDKGYAVHGMPVKDTLQPFKALAALYDRTKKPEVLALVAGALTHMVTDSVFHPFVYYYTGSDLTRHYRIETLMDTHLSCIQSQWLDAAVSTQALYKPLRPKMETLIPCLTTFFDVSDRYVPELKKALKTHCFALGLFKSRLGFHVFRLTSLFGSEDHKRKIHLFYPSDMKWDTPFFDSHVEYRHPVTGEAKSDSLSSLVNQAIQQSVLMFQDMQTACERNALSNWFYTQKPVSLETGLDPSMGRDLRYTDLACPIDCLVENGC